MARSQLDTIQSTINEEDLTYGEQIGRGGSGDVYRATWDSKELGRLEVAAKKIPLYTVEDTYASLVNEISYLQKLDHPNIIKYYGHVVTKKHVTIVTEYAAKGSLYDYLQTKVVLPHDLKWKWARQGAHGIKCLQENKVLHRDIKSPNFLITENDDLKICDFGISKDLSSTKTTTSNKGTFKWLAPEAFTEFQLSPTADIFSYGIVLWELETCLEPYPGIRPETVMFKVGSEGLRPEIPDTCDPIWRNLMQQCWDGNRKKRPSVDQIIDQLQVESLQAAIIPSKAVIRKHGATALTNSSRKRPKTNPNPHAARVLAPLTTPEIAFFGQPTVASSAALSQDREDNTMANGQKGHVHSTVCSQPSFRKVPTPLMLAVASGTDITDKLLVNSDVNCQNPRNGETALHIAARRNNISAAKKLLESGAKVNMEDSNGRTPLHTAIASGDINIFRLLILDRSTNVNAKTKQDGTTPMILVARQYLSNTCMIEELVAAGADINASDNNGKTALHWAAQVNNTNAVNFLLMHRVKRDAQDMKDQTPLFLAAKEGSYASAKLLLDHYANREISDHLDISPLHIARDANHLDIVRLLQTHRVINSSHLVQRVVLGLGN